MNLERAISLIKDYARQNYKNTTRMPQGKITYPFIVPGSQSYQNCLWDMDSWLTNVAVRQMLAETGDTTSFYEYERGCILNFLEHQDEDGAIPIVLLPDRDMPTKEEIYSTNMHKPCLIQHIAFVVKENNNDVSWIRDKIANLEAFLGVFMKYYRHKTGLYFWLDDFAIGVDNDPCTFYRPEKSSGAIYLNCLLYKEFLAMEYICRLLGETDKASFYKNEAEGLKQAISTHCYDERDGFFYSVDFNLRPVDPSGWLHTGAPRHWDCLIQRIDVWSGIMALWVGVATPEQAARTVEHITDERTFWAPYGMRTLSKMEKMYTIIESNNPSCWLGPIWGISNYITFSALLNYGYDDRATEIAEKTILLFGRDIEDCGEMHEYYDPDTGEGVSNPGFQNWNLLALNMIAYLEGRDRMKEHNWVGCRAIES